VKNALKAALLVTAAGWAGFGSGPAHAGAVCGAVAGNLVANCGFDAGGGAALGSTPPASWTLSSTDSTNSFSAIGSDNLSSPNAFYFATGGSNVDTLSQTLADTVGQSYTVTFYLAYQHVTSATDSNGLSVSWNSNPAQFSATNYFTTNGPLHDGYTMETFNVVGTGSDTLNFAGYETQDYLYIDEISVAASAPEPASLLLLGAGLAGLGAARRRRNSSVD